MSIRPRAVVACATVSVAVLAGLLASGCSGTERQWSPDGEATPPAEATRTPDATRSTDPAPLSDLSIGLEPVATGLREPVFVTHAGDGSGRLFVLEQGGLVRVLREGRLADRPFLDIRGRVSSGGERGLLGLAFAPDFESSGEFYVNYTDASGDTVVERYVADDPASDRPSLSAPRALLRVDQPYANHNGGCIAFAPDGTLWVGMGDGGSAGDPERRAQNPRELLGKMISLDVDAVRPRPAIVGSGLRNPWRFSFDRETGDLWIGDVGQNAWEEIDYLPWDQARGSNFGWDLWEGNHPYPEGSSPSRDGFVFPAIEYGHDQGNSVTGGYVYRGSRYPELEGTYLYADFGSGRIWGARVSASGDVTSRLVMKDSGTAPSSFGEDEDGEVYVVDYNGRILRVTAQRR